MTSNVHRRYFTNLLNRKAKIKRTVPKDVDRRSMAQTVPSKVSNEQPIDQENGQGGETRKF